MTAELSTRIRATLAALESFPSGPQVQGYVEGVRDLLLEQLMSFLVRDSPEAAKVAAVILSITDKDLFAQWQPKLDKGAAMPRNSEVESTKLSLNLLILTVKKVEFLACLAAFGITSVDPDVRVGEDCDLWTAEVGGVTIGICVIGTEGNVEAAIEIHRIASEVDFGAAVLVGMAAGLEGEVKKGDVVVSSWVYAYDFVRATTEKYISRAKAYPGDARAWQKMAQLETSRITWAEKIRNEVAVIRQTSDNLKISESELAEWNITFKSGVILAGSRLIEDNTLPQMKIDVNDRALAAEMEGAGFAASCTSMRVPWLVVRGIADYGKDDVGLAVAAEDYAVASANAPVRDKSWQYPATYAAAAFVRDMIVSGRIPLIPRGTRQ